MSYTFTSGKYRTKVVSSFLKMGNLNPITSESETIPFECDVVPVFRFKTNPSIQVDESTLTAVGATLINSGFYKGLAYKIYDNNLAIVSGVQDENIVGADEKPWAVEGVEYIYAKAIFCSGNVFRTDYGKELQFGLCGFASGTSDATTLFFGRNWDYINFQNINWDNLTSYTSILNTYTKDADGFNEFKDYIFNQTQITDLGSIFSALRMSEKVVTYEVVIPSRITAATYMFSSFGGPGITLDLRMESFISNSLYSVGAGKLNLRIDNPIPSGSYLVNYSDVYEVYADIEIDSTATYAPIFNQNSNLRYVSFSNRFDTSCITNFNYMFINNPALIDVSRRQGDEHYGYQYSNPFDFASAKNFHSMFQGDTSLASFGRRTDRSLIIDTNTKYMTYTNMFMGCSSLHLDVQITERTGYIMSMQSAFEESGIRRLDFTQYGTAGRLLQIMSDDFRFACRNATNLQYLTFTFGSTFGVANVKYNSMCYGCTSLKEVTIDGAYIYDSSTGYQYSSLDDTTEMFKNCTNLEELTIYECDIGNDSSGGVTDMLSGCTALRSIALSTNTIVPSSKAITLPKIMYLNGSAVSSITKGRGSQAIYTSTP